MKSPFAWTPVRRFFQIRQSEFGLCLRVTVSALLAYAAADYLQAPLVLWPVLVSVILTQMNVGKSLKATIDYFIGTLGGAVYSGLLSFLIPHTTEPAVLGILALTVAPVALVAAFNPSFASAPFTAILVLLWPLIAHVSPFESALYRVSEVLLGCVVALLVSLLVFPARARHSALAAAAQMLDLAANALPQLIAPFGQTRDVFPFHAVQDALGKAFATLNAMEAEAKRERIHPFVVEPGLDPLIYTLLRLRHDLVMIGRCVHLDLPEDFKARLAPKLSALAETGAEFLRASGKALLSRTPIPSLEPNNSALVVYHAEITALRSEGRTLELSIDSVEGLFALGFALDQLSQNLRELRQRITEIAGKPE